MNDASTQQCADFEDAWLDEAFETLHPYGSVFTAQFMNEHGLSPSGALGNMHHRIRKKVSDPKDPLRFEHLVAYLDELKMWGKQHVFLFRLEERDKEKGLAELSDPTYVKKRLESLGLEDRYNDNICIWNAAKPMLAEARHVFDDQGEALRLSFKWIETRAFQKVVDNRFEVHRERSTNFFIIDLKDGSAQLRLQSLPERSLKSIEKQYDLYHEEIRRLLGSDCFSLVSLEPRMKQFLVRSILPLTFWSIKTRKGTLQGNVNPALLVKLRLPFQKVDPREIRAYWECKQEATGRRRLYFTMRAPRSEVEFNAITDKAKVDFILDKLLEAESAPPIESVPNGVRDRLLGRIKEETPHAGLKSAAVEASILAPVALTRIIFATFGTWLKEVALEALFGIPPIVLELVVYFFILLVFYGSKRVKKYLFNIPRNVATKTIKIILGKETSDVVINSEEYRKWEARRPGTGQPQRARTPGAEHGTAPPAIFGRQPAEA